MNKDLINKRILVTGGAGFIGSNLCEFLIESGSQVTCLDNLSTGYITNIENLLHNKNFKFIEGDIRNINTCQDACRGVDYVFHQAALGSVPRSIENPVITNEVNVGGFLNMLVSSKDNKIKRFIYASSSSVYGDVESSPKTEDEIGSQLSPYAISKFTNEIYAKNFKQIFDLDTVGLRYFNVFGKRQDPNGAYAAVIPKFIKMLIKNEQPVINGDGTYSRDFTHINNVIQMNVKALISKNIDSMNNVYNTAVGESTTIMELFELIKSFLEKYDKNISNIKPIFGNIREEMFLIHCFN